MARSSTTKPLFFWTCKSLAVTFVPFASFQHLKIKQSFALNLKVQLITFVPFAASFLKFIIIIKYNLKVKKNSTKKVLILIISQFPKSYTLFICWTLAKAWNKKNNWSKEGSPHLSDQASIVIKNLSSLSITLYSLLLYIQNYCICLYFFN